MTSFDEVAACGTAVVITPVGSITFDGEEHDVSNAEECGPISSALYRRIRAIQQGDEEDIFGWTVRV